MKADLPTRVGVGFTILVATATFLVAIVAALFLIWQPDANTIGQERLPAQIQAAVSPDMGRAPATAEPSPYGSRINPAPQRSQ